MITQDQWRDHVAMLTDSELSALAAVLVDEQRKRDEAAQRLSDEQAAREWADNGWKSCPRYSPLLLAVRPIAPCQVPESLI